MVNNFKYIVFISLFLFSCSLHPDLNKKKSINVITTNDIHGMLADQNADFMNPNFPPVIIGAAGFQKYIKDLKIEYQNENEILIFDSGNFFQGHPMGIVDSGKTVIDWMNKVGYNALVPAQHDFIFGYENLLELSERADFPFVACNLLYQDTNEHLFQPYTIIESNNKNIGILGIVPSNLKDIVLGNNLNGLKIEPEIESIQKWVKELKTRNVDAIILLSSLGIPWDREKVYKDFLDKYSKSDYPNHPNSIELGFYSQGIDFIFSGGISKGYDTPWYDPYSHVYTFQNYGNLTGFSHFLINFDENRNIVSGYSNVVSNKISQTLFLDDFNYFQEDYNWIQDKLKAAIDKTYLVTDWDSKVISDDYNISYSDSLIIKNDWDVPSFSLKNHNILTWNCEFFPTANDSTILAMIEVINDMQVDIIAFQEIKQRGWFYKLMKSLPDYGFVISKQSSFMDQALIYKKDSYSLVKTTELFAESDYNFAGRPPLQCDLFSKKDNKKLSLINLHMKCCDSGLNRRKKAAKMLYDYLDNKIYENSDIVYLVLGDWNDDLKDEPGEHCFNDFLNDDRYFFPTFDITYDLSQASYPKEPYVSFLDHILATKNLIKEYDVKTIRLDQYMGSFKNYETYISDHLPVLLSFE